MVQRTKHTRQIHHLREVAIYQAQLVYIAVIMIQSHHRLTLLACRQTEEMVAYSLATHFRHEHTGLLHEHLFRVHHIRCVVEHMLHKAFLLVPSHGFLALLAGLQVHTTLGKERVLAAVISLQLTRTRVTVLHRRISITVARLPVLRTRHIVLKRRTEQLSPVDLFLARLKIELDIRRVSQLLIPAVRLILLRVLPTFGICPESIALLEIFRRGLFLQFY